MSISFATMPSKRLAQGITSSSSSFYVNNIIGFNTTDSLDVTSANLGTQHYVVFRNDTGTKIEIMEIDPTTISTGPITIVRRGLSYYGDRTTEVTANKLDWSANETIVNFGTDAPQLFQYLKEYIDAAAIAGTVPASTTTPGIVERATQAEADAGTGTNGSYDLFVRADNLRGRLINDYAADSVGTDSYAITISPAITAYAAGQRFTFKAGTANTGACTLNVSGLGAKSIVKNYNVALSTGDIKANQIVEVEYDGTNMQLLSNKMVDATTDIYGIVPNANLPTPTFQQLLPTLSAAVPSRTYMGSNADGSVVVIWFSDTVMRRYARDSVTGTYYATHEINPTVSYSNCGNLVVIGSYIYTVHANANAIASTRFLLADLTGETNMTVPVVADTGTPVGWTDGTYFYVIGGSTSTTSRKWSVSGTTFSAVTTDTCVSGLPNNNYASFYDGTSVYMVSVTFAGVSTIKKLTDIMATAVTTTTLALTMGGTYSSNEVPYNIAFNADTNKMYIGKAYEIFNATTTYTAHMIFIPITKP